MLLRGKRLRVKREEVMRRSFHLFFREEDCKRYIGYRIGGM